MNPHRRVNVRLLVIAFLALALLGALIVATGGGFSGSGSSSPSSASPVAEAPTVPPAGQLQGEVTVSVRHLQGNAWQFVYMVHNTGTTPIGGLQINAPRSNLYHVVGRPGWSYFGSGVCGGKYSGVLIYWSTGRSSPRVIAPKHAAHFGFTVNTSGVISVNYSLSWDSTHPAFGTIKGPAASSIPASAACGT